MSFRIGAPEVNSNIWVLQNIRLNIWGYQLMAWIPRIEVREYTLGRVSIPISLRESLVPRVTPFGKEAIGDEGEVVKTCPPDCSGWKVRGLHHCITPSKDSYW